MSEYTENFASYVARQLSVHGNKLQFEDGNSLIRSMVSVKFDADPKPANARHDDLFDYRLVVDRIGPSFWDTDTFKRDSVTGELVKVQESAISINDAEYERMSPPATVPVTVDEAIFAVESLFNDSSFKLVKSL